MGFGGECGNSRAARADGTHAWVWNRRSEQLARMECDWAAHTTALGTADAAKWVNRREYCSTQPRATISMDISTGPSGRSVTEAAERCRGRPNSGRWYSGFLSSTPVISTGWHAFCDRHVRRDSSGPILLIHTARRTGYKSAKGRRPAERKATAACRMRSTRPCGSSFSRRSPRRRSPRRRSGSGLPASRGI